MIKFLMRKIRNLTLVLVLLFVAVYILFFKLDIINFSKSTASIAKKEKPASSDSSNIPKSNKKANNNTIIKPKVTSVNLDVPLISQMPELYNGCEITSLTMLLNYKGIEVDKVTLADEMITDPAPISYNSDGTIYSWGNPSIGFVGDVTGHPNVGYAIDPKPLIPLISKYYSKGALDLTNKRLADIEKSLANDNPVIVWVTADFSRPDNFLTWIDSNGNTVNATFETHAILLTGYDDEDFYYNDPLNELKDAIVSKEHFNLVWTDMGKKALSVA